LKGNMEERLAEAERRRSLVQQSQRRPRGQTLPSVEEKKVITKTWKPKDDDGAARVIQKAWRNWKRKQTLSTFMQLGLTLENIQSSDFEDVGALLSEDKVLDCTSKVLRIYGLQNDEADSIAARAAVRTFLSAFLVLGHPTQVLSKEGEQEKDLIEKAENLLLPFNQIATSPFSSPSHNQLVILSEAYMSFQVAFTAWKAQDSTVLLKTMLAQFVELDAIWQSVKEDKEGRVADDYREGIQNNQTLLLARLKRLAGAERAMKMIKEAIKKNRKANAKKKSVGDIRPRAAMNIAEDDLSIAENPASNSSSEPFVSREVTSLLPDNRTVIHELAINKEYRIDISPKTNMREDIIRIVSEKMRREFESEFGDAFIVAMAEMIREKLFGLVAPGKSLHALISESLDTSMIANDVKIGAFSYQRFFNFMSSLLPKICAPVRDIDVKAFVEDQTEDPIERLAGLNYVIDLLSIDHANFILQSNASALIKEASGYEQRCFAGIVNDQPLHRTLQWWKDALKGIRESEARTGSANKTSPYRIYMQGLVSTAIAVGEVQDVDIPETLELDRERIKRIRNDVHRIVIIDSILLTAKNLMRRDPRSIWKEQAQRMWELPFEKPQAFIAVVESRYALPPTTKTQLSGTIERILVDARDRQVTHPVVSVLLKKFRAHVLNRLSAVSADERDKAASTASQVLSSSGLPEFVAQIGALVDELKRVGDVDRDAHGKWYDDVAAIVSMDESQNL
ncbi:MAG: hypothetical protein Q9190_006780, partial [Brigantiaea leucoxantha]